MWGNRWWDFGDLVRSASFRGEDFCLQRYQILLVGFLGARTGAGAVPERHLRAELDADAVVDAPLYVAFLLVLRYLTDHLSGDRHFKVTEAGDNLRRAEERFARLERMVAERAAMAAVLDSQLRATVSP